MPLTTSLVSTAVLLSAVRELSCDMMAGAAAASCSSEQLVTHV